jgi:uncharacterized protein with PIN domain
LAAAAIGALKMGDCSACACAGANATSLLFNGGDFTMTDTAAAR